MNLLSTQQAAEKLGLSDGRVRRLILDGRLPAIKVGRDHLIQESDLALVADRKPGRPAKPKDDATTEAPAAEATAEAITTPAAEPITKTVKAKRKPKAKAAQKDEKSKRKAGKAKT